MKTVNEVNEGIQAGYRFEQYGRRDETDEQMDDNIGQEGEPEQQRGETDSEQAGQQQTNTIVFHDVGSWPYYPTKERLRTELVWCGPSNLQNKDGPFPFDKNYRSLSKDRMSQSSKNMRIALHIKAFNQWKELFSGFKGVMLDQKLKCEINQAVTKLNEILK